MSDDHQQQTGKVIGGIVLTEEQKRRRRSRSVALALVLGALAIIFFLVTIIKVGPGVLTPPR